MTDLDFDDGRLEASEVSPRADELLRSLAGAGARVRRESQVDASALASALDAGSRPRGVIALGPEARLVRAVLEPVCPVPFMAWPHEGLPAWVGALDLVVVLAPSGSDRALMTSAREAVRRGASVLIAAEPTSPVAELAGSRSTVLLPVATGDPLAAVVQVLSVLHHLGLGPRVVPDQVAEAADLVAEESSPHVDLASNPAKEVAVALADALPLVWGGSVLAARASRRVAEALRRATGRPALAADATALLPVITAVAERDPFADPFEDAPGLRPVLVVLDDHSDDPTIRRDRGELLAAAEAHDVRVCLLEVPVGMETSQAMESYITLLQKGLFAAAWLAVGLGEI